MDISQQLQSRRSLDRQLRLFQEALEPKGKRGQLGVGRTTESTTGASSGPVVASSFRPSCFSIATNTSSPLLASNAESIGTRENARFHSNNLFSSVGSTTGRSHACWIPRIKSAIDPAFLSVVTKVKRSSAGGGPQQINSPLASRGIGGIVASPARSSERSTIVPCWSQVGTEMFLPAHSQTIDWVLPHFAVNPELESVGEQRAQHQL